MCFLVKAAASIQVATCKFTCTCHHIQDKQQVRKLFNIVEFMITGYGRQVFYALILGGFFICAYIFVYVTESAKRYTNAQAMIFLYKRCYSKTRNIFYSLKKIIFGA